ncbi:SH3 domain-binding glutamic acid-rich protein homolog [Myripristis murdjan]|uniref:SH3 domain-binding glutamic acid-rich protein homolog n=1 Tax=Myripristis murdjan TaxID=586833 RepID=A0A667WYN8_9TELE|nr:SH3 domain-binding glutamic acid-rich protein homolog [Myripristis murdjan]
MKVVVYYSSVTGTLEMKKRQQRIFFVLESKNIPFETVDVAVDDGKEEMRRKMQDPTAVPPQIFNGDTYCGDFDSFDNAVEMEQLEAFLKL